MVKKILLLGLLLLFLLGIPFLLPFFGISLPPQYGGNAVKKILKSIHPSPSPGMGNPASINCVKKGGHLAITLNSSGGQYGLCLFEDDLACEEWAMFRGDCPVGGVRTTGYTTIEQKYCAWRGGKTLATPGATCTLPNGHICPNDAVYNGTCE